MRFHVVALPHTQTHKRHAACAYTTKVRRFCTMMKSLGHAVFHYGAEGSDVCCDEDIVVLTRAEQEGFFGPFDQNVMYALDWSGKAPYWALRDERAAAAINARKQKGDFLCIIDGNIGARLAQMIGPTVMPVEYGIGYEGTFSQYRVFESYSHMHTVWGKQSPIEDRDGRFYDVVIPNYFDPSEYPFKAEKGDYYLYLGRLIRRKGINIAVETCKRLGVKLKIAGQGVKQIDGNRIACTDGEVYEGDNLEYVGCVIGDARAKLFQEAKGVFVPTVYVEPFGGVAVEAQLAGTPVITTDWGAFTETVEHGKTGYRCRTLDHFTFAAQNVVNLDPFYIHKRAVANWSMDHVRWMYQEYFQMLSDLWGKGWYAERNRTQLDWLR